MLFFLEQLDPNDLPDMVIREKPVRGYYNHRNMWVLGCVIKELYGFYHYDQNSGLINLVSVSMNYMDGLTIYNKTQVFNNYYPTSEEAYSAPTNNVWIPNDTEVLEHVENNLLSLIKKDRTHEIKDFDFCLIYHTKNKNWVAIRPSLENLVNHHKKNQEPNPNYIKFLEGQQAKALTEEKKQTNIPFASVK